MARTSGSRRSKGRRRKSKAVPALVLMSLAGTACIAGWVVLSRPTAAPEPDDGMGLPAPDLAEIGRGGVAEIILKDQGDPTRVVAIIAYDSQTPIGQGRYDTVKPRAWVYLDDGSYLHIRADEGRFYAPDEQRPQTGVMKGDVVLRIFDPAPERPSEDAEAPVVIRVPQVSFDTEYGGIWSDVPGVATTPELSFAFNDLRIVVNQVEERIELLEIRGGGRIAYTPAPDVEPALEPASPEAFGSLGLGRRASSPAVHAVSLAQSQPEGVAPPPGDPATPRRAEPEPEAVHYFAQFSREVRVAQGGVVATGDLLEVHARVVENRIPDGPVVPNDPRRGGEAQVSRPGTATVIRTALASTARAAGNRASSSQWPPVRRGLVPTDDPHPTPADAGATPGPDDAPPETSEVVEPARAMPAPAVESREPITLDWAGPLTLRPLAAEPAELRREHLSARLTGGEGGGVSLADEGSGATGSCARLEYGFTTQSVVLAGVGDAGTRLSAGAGGDDPERADAPAGGTLRSGRTEYSVRTGVGRVPGPGTLEGQGFQRIAWTGQMDFVLQSKGGQVLAEPEEVIFQGDVRGEDEGTSFDAGFARATFAPAGDGPGARSTISSVLLDEAVTLRGGQDERVSASRVRVEFDQAPAGADAPAARPGPSFFEAEGAVVATRPGERVEAERVEGTMAPDEGGRPEVRTLSARGGVMLSSRPEGLEVSGEALDVDAQALRLRVEGTPAALARVVRGSTTIRGVDVRLAGRPREARVLGLGEFAHEARQPVEGGLDALGGRQASAGASTTFDASWTQVMTFDDDGGSLRCVGDVVATMREGSVRVDRLSAWNVEASIEPARPAAAPATQSAADPVEPEPMLDAPVPQIANPNAPRGGLTESEASEAPQGAEGDPPLPADRNRRLLTLVATGSSADSPDGERARVESRRYGPPAPDGTAVLQELLYLEGDRILYDNQGGTLDVPGPGKLMVVDRRTPEGERQPEAGALGGGSARGDGLFEWQGSLHLDRLTGEVTMLDAVTLVHRRAGDGTITRLEAPRLTAQASADGDGVQGGGAGLGSGRLRRVHADGGVWVKSGEQEVTAQVVEYDADAGVLTAFTPGGTVRVSQGGSIFSAAAVRWDMNAGRIEIIDPGGLVAPR